MARKLEILVIADEVYGHLAFGSKLFVPMGVFGSIVPVFTLGSMSKRWIVPGWRLGWLVITDPSGILQKSQVDSLSPSLSLSICVCVWVCSHTHVNLFLFYFQIVQNIKDYLHISPTPATFIQVGPLEEYLRISCVYFLELATYIGF